MAVVGQSEAEALHLVGQQATETDALRNFVNKVGATVQSLAGGSYISATTQALMAKFENETRPQFEKAIAHSESSQAGTKEACLTFSECQNNGAARLTSI